MPSDDRARAYHLHRKLVVCSVCAAAPSTGRASTEMRRWCQRSKIENRGILAAADGAGGLAGVAVDVAAVLPSAQLVEHPAEVVRAATRHQPCTAISRSIPVSRNRHTLNRVE